MLDEDGPRQRPARLTPPRLDAWDVDDLREYVAELQTEILRAEAAMQRKQAQREAANAFFRPGGGR